MLTEDQIKAIVHDLKNKGDVLFQDKATRDEAYRICLRLQRGGELATYTLKRGSTGHQLLDPRYTFEGRDLPDQGMNNAYRTGFGNLYKLAARYDPDFG